LGIRQRSESLFNDLPGEGIESMADRFGVMRLMFCLCFMDRDAVNRVIDNGVACLVGVFLTAGDASAIRIGGVETGGGAADSITMTDASVSTAAAARAP